MFESLKRLFRRKKPAQPQKRGPVSSSTGYAAGRSPATGRPDPLLDPFNQVADYEPARQHSSSASSCSYDSGWSSSDSSSSSSSCD